MFERKYMSIKLNISRLFSMRVSRMCTDAFREARDRRKIDDFGFDLPGPGLGGTISQTKFLPENGAPCFFTAVYDVRMLFCNRLRVEVQVCGTCGRAETMLCGCVWTRKLLKTERKVFVSKFIRMRMDGAWICKPNVKLSIGISRSFCKRNMKRLPSLHMSLMQFLPAVPIVCWAGPYVRRIYLVRILATTHQCYKDIMQVAVFTSLMQTLRCFSSAEVCRTESVVSQLGSRFPQWSPNETASRVCIRVCTKDGTCICEIIFVFLKVYLPTIWILLKRYSCAPYWPRINSPRGRMAHSGSRWLNKYYSRQAITRFANVFTHGINLLLSGNGAFVQFSFNLELLIGVSKPYLFL